MKPSISYTQWSLIRDNRLTELSLWRLPLLMPGKRWHFAEGEKLAYDAAKAERIAEHLPINEVRIWHQAAHLRRPTNRGKKSATATGPEARRKSQIKFFQRLATARPGTCAATLRGLALTGVK